METRQIPLGNGVFALVDANDYDRLMKRTWFVGRKGYAMCRRRKGVSGTTMHRIILDPPKGYICDHINGNRLDNRRCNLRVVNALQNAQNRGNNHNSRSQYKGVAWKVENDKWQARIRANGKQYHIGLYDTEEAAAEAYNKAAKLHHGVYARLNKLPDWYKATPDTGECPLCHHTQTVREYSKPEWQPIETAPKDGTFIDVWADGKRHTHVYWFKHYEQWCYNTVSGQSYMPDSIGYGAKATHWMPLPKPPITDVEVLPTDNRNE